jgi:hypothetical protein
MGHESRQQNHSELQPAVDRDEPRAVWLGISQNEKVGTGGVLALTAGGILLLSALWSIDPQTTIRRGILYLFAVIGAIGIAATLDADEFMDVLGLTCAISAVASILLLGISPGKSLIVSSHDFIGIFSPKNVLGQAMAAGTLASLHGIRVGRRRPLNAVMPITDFVDTSPPSQRQRSHQTRRWAAA